MNERPIEPIQPPRGLAPARWQRRLVVAIVLGLWCWLPYRFLPRLTESLAFSGGILPFTDLYWGLRTAVWLGGLGLLVSVLSTRTREWWLPTVVIASCWIIVLGGALNLAMFGYLIGQGVGLDVLPSLLLMLVGGVGLVVAGQRFLGWMTLLAFAPLGCWFMACCGVNPASAVHADGLVSMVAASAAAVVSGLAWEMRDGRRATISQPRMTHAVASILVVAGAIQIAPVLARLTLGHCPPWAPRYWAVGRPIIWDCDLNDEIMAARRRDPLAWYIHSAPSAGDAGSPALAKCWVLAGPHRGLLPDYAGVRLVEEGVYPAAVEQARRDLGLE